MNSDSHVFGRGSSLGVSRHGNVQQCGVESLHVVPHHIPLAGTVWINLFQECVPGPRIVTAQGQRILQHILIVVGLLKRVMVGDVVRTSVVVLILESCGSSCSSKCRRRRC